MVRRYEQVVLEFSTLISQGVLRPGDRIPSVRKACQQYRVNAGTILQAYGQLEARGLINARPRSGYYVRCSTIVKGTEQQVSINTPGVPGAMCMLQSPAVGSRSVQTPSNIILPKSKHNVAVSCTAQCYAPGVATLASHTEIMTAGNVVFGGLIGLGVDAASGAMNTYDANVDVIMTPIPACGKVPGKKARGTPMASAN